MNIQENKRFVDQLWEQSILPTLMEYIKIPNKSPAFDPQWQVHGYMDKAMKLLEGWCAVHAVPGMKMEIVRLTNRTPLLFIEIPGNNEDTVLLYGHMDKQPEMKGWDADLSPWTPVLKNGKLYGRGGADDGYSTFASLAAIQSLKAQRLPHARCVILIEACEESGSYDLPYYIDALQARIGQPNLIVCLDSGCGNYDQLWMTTSLRGLAGGILSIEVLKQGIHSGSGSGVVPSCMMILRQLLDRIENAKSGDIRLKELFVDIPKQRIQQAKKVAKILGDDLYQEYPFSKGVKPVTHHLTDIVLNRSWHPALSVTGCDGFPLPENAGNVTLPSLRFKLSCRLAPTCDPEIASNALKKTLEKNPPFGAKVEFSILEKTGGWNAPVEDPWLLNAINQASLNYFSGEAMYIGEGGSIPFMGMLGKKFPKAQFMITGLLGPGSNAHGPNEFLHIQAGKNLTCCVAEVIAKHYQK